MIQYVLVALLIAWLVKEAGYAPILIDGLYDLTKYQLTEPAYYLAFALLGVLLKILQKS